MTVPSWVRDTVFYQIFPDRFADGDPTNNPSNAQAWQSKPTIWNFQGGDLRGIIKKFDYLIDLGISGLYLNPIFQSTSNHRYNTYNYYQIDSKLGDINDFKELLELAHRNGIKVILDGVFNHCGRGFYAFNDLMENQKYSPYKDWFHINNFPVYAYSKSDSNDYLSWWDIKSLPKFNINNPEVRQYIFNVARHWIRLGADGWRLDVPNEIDDDSFWQEFRHEVKSENSDAYLVGEIWTADSRWVGDRHFDGLMNYPLRDQLTGLLNENGQTISKFADGVEALVSNYPQENAFAMYLPLGSHDTKRLMTKLHGNLKKIKLAYLFQFSFPGAPAVYYGDEIGMTGGKDPDCRGTFPWSPDDWDIDLQSWVKGLISKRNRHRVLRQGRYIRIKASDDHKYYAFVRTLDDEAILIVINAGSSDLKLSLPVRKLGWVDGNVINNLLSKGETVVRDGSVKIEIPAWSGVWLKK